MENFNEKIFIKNVYNTFFVCRWWPGRYEYSQKTVYSVGIYAAINSTLSD